MYSLQIMDIELEWVPLVAIEVPILIWRDSFARKVLCINIPSSRLSYSRVKIPRYICSRLRRVQQKSIKMSYKNIGYNGEYKIVAFIPTFTPLVT